MSTPPSTPPQAFDRLQFLLAQGAAAAWNGIDYVELADATQTLLRVHFLTSVAVAPPASGPPLGVTITGGETIPAVAVAPIDPASAWSQDADGRPLLTLRVAAPGDFSTYTLRLTGAAALDPFFDAVTFSFKANCSTELDPESPSPAPPAAPLTSATQASAPVAIDYLAKDFAGFTQALSDFSALRYPGWVERSEADVGVMVMEALCALADELSYYQDRVAAEARITTATQRVSLVRHARLVDYEPAPAMAATTVLQLEVGANTPVPAGLVCSAPGADGTQIPFAVGDGLADAERGTTYPVNIAWNARGPSGEANLLPYWWDSARRPLPAGSSRLWLLGHGLQLGDGQRLLIDTAGPASADPPVRELVTIAGAPVETSDPVFGAQLTEIAFAAPTALAHDLARTQLAGNIVPAVQGTRTVETFAIPAAPGSGVSLPAGVARAAVRAGANSTADDPRPTYLHTLATSELAWLPLASADLDVNADAAAGTVPSPQIAVSAAGQSTDGPAQSWSWVRWLLDSGPQDTAFTLTPERYTLVGGDGEVDWFEYDGEGVTIRFGDGTFGQIPQPGVAFTVTYLSGGGTAGNVPADTIVTFHTDPLAPGAAEPVITACTNPFPATGGADAETPQQIVDHAPQAFAAEPLRIVTPADYVVAAQSQPWVQQAGTTFRWTGSWLTALTSANPAGAEVPSDEQLAELAELLDGRRLAGYENYVLAPSYVSVDLRITVAAVASALASDVADAVLAALEPGPGSGGGGGFFDHARWGFGQPLAPSALVAAVQRAPGVAGVLGVLFRQRGVQPAWAPLAAPVAVSADRILRVDNDPSRPEAGSLRIIVEGGK